MPGRTIAIGDIHGCSLALDALLDSIKPRTGDSIITLGDYIDRGMDSRGVLDRLIELAQCCRLVSILGNHDQMLLDVRSGKHPIYWFFDMGGTTTLDSYGAGRDLSLSSLTNIMSFLIAAWTTTKPTAISSYTLTIFRTSP